MNKIKKQAFITDWAIVKYPEVEIARILDQSSDNDICDGIIFPDSAFTELTDKRQISLFGRAVSDHRYNPETEEFADGHRVMTTQILEVKNGIVITENTIYVLGEMNENYKLWCKENVINEPENAAFV